MTKAQTAQSGGGDGGLSIRRVPVSTLHQDPANVNRHPDNNLRAIRDSIKTFGQVEPLVVQKGTGKVIGGNGRLEVLARDGATEVDVVELDIDDTKAAALGIALNRTAKTSEFDDASLAAVLATLPTELQLGAGFDESELRALDTTLDKPVVEDEAPAPLPEPVSKRGDIWTLGGHRLMCGDSTDGGDVALCLNGERAGLCFTSPPYAQQRAYTEASKEHVSDWDKLMRGVFANLPMADDGQVLVNLGLVHAANEWVPYWEAWIEWMREQGWRRFGWYVWDKKHPLPGTSHGRLLMQHEWIFHFCKEAVETVPTVERQSKSGETWYGLRATDGSHNKQSKSRVESPYRVAGSVISVAPEEGRCGAHPASFPIRLASSFVECWPGDIYEPFSGSGTTIIACEQLGRRCYAIEIEPRYVDVAIRRWQKLTGKAATLDGKAWAYVAAERGVKVDA